MRKRVENHFTSYKLNDLYCTHASEEFINIKFQLKKLFNSGGYNSLKEHILDCYESRKENNLNSWQTAFYGCLSNDEEFLTKFNELVKSQDAMRRLTIHYEGTNIEFNEARQKMAIVPTNSILIDNPVSAAPGYKIENLFVFAGVPKIMQGMFHTIINDLSGGKKLLSKTVSSNLGEGLIAKDLENIESEFIDVKIGSYPYFKPGNFGTSVVLRSENKNQLNEASKKVLISIINLGGKGKILEENEIDDRSL